MGVRGRGSLGSSCTRQNQPCRRRARLGPEQPEGGDTPKGVRRSIRVRRVEGLGGNKETDGAAVPRWAPQELLGAGEGGWEEGG